jgi:hypothetical protein
MKDYLEKMTVTLEQIPEEYYPDIVRCIHYASKAGPYLDNKKAVEAAWRIEEYAFGSPRNQHTAACERTNLTKANNPALPDDHVTFLEHEPK